MIAVGVRDEEVRDPLSLHRAYQCVDVCGVTGARVDDGDIAFADDVRAGSLEGELARIVGDYASDARRDAITATVFDVDVVDVRDRHPTSVADSGDVAG